MIKSFIVCCLVSTIVLGVLALLMRPSWEIYFDQASPVISLPNDSSRIGVGGDGGKLELTVEDQAPGLDEVIVRLCQLRSDRELFRKKLSGIARTSLSINITAERGVVGEGPGELEIVAFDRSFYNNRATVLTKAFIDTKLPFIEALSAQHNLRQGGAQLVIYSAKDENLVFSGVRVGDRLFPGYPAGQLDSSLNRQDLFVALYSVPVGSSIRPDDIRLRAVDVGGNATEQPFYNKIARRQPRMLTPNNARLINWLGSLDPLTFNQPFDGAKTPGAFKAAAVDAATLVQSFDKVSGTAVLAYADKFSSTKFPGFEAGSFFVFAGLSEAKALHDGEVVLVKRSANVESVVLDHGLGLQSVYRGIRSALVQEGQVIKSGTVLGRVDNYLGIGARIVDTPIDPTEWWSQDWVSAHIYEKLQDVKKSLGIVVE